MEKQKIIIEPPLVIGNFTFTVISSLVCNGAQTPFGIYFYGYKKPIVVVISSPNQTAAFTTSGNKLPLDILLKYVPELAGLFKS